jgi:arylsulfatase
VVADREVPSGHHVLSVEFVASGRNDDPAQPGFNGTATLYIDDEAVGSGDIVTQPGAFCLVGDGLCVGRDSASPVSPAYEAPFRFTGGTIDKVVVDVSGERYIDHEAQVRAWFAIDQAELRNDPACRAASANW